MEQFSLEKYLENPQCKVVTRRGNPVRIICTDRKHGEDELPVVLLEQCHNGEFLLACRKDGRSDPYDTPYDLFFADEEEELTELQKTLEEDCDYYVNLYNDGKTREELREWIKCWCHRIIDLARKEIRKEEQEKLGTLEMPIDPLNPHYQKGREDALKDLPKWKRAIENKEFEKHVCVMDYYMYPFLDTEVNEGDYYIELSDLKNLPKEE